MTWKSRSKRAQATERYAILFEEIETSRDTFERESLIGRLVCRVVVRHTTEAGVDTIRNAGDGRYDDPVLFKEFAVTAML
jgi:hypothetical protein